MFAEQKSSASHVQRLYVMIMYDMCSIKLQIVLKKIVSVTEIINTIKTKNVRNLNEYTKNYDNEYSYRSFSVAQIYSYHRP